ncbi:nurim homolog [Sitodiplosis mosellana]|uniref:nurim homolog n=1 Tax=Sitodiplosis mosellana TaxID=263140 RepID=UPI002444DD2F|nr:nurim homolog [Sitodiplosis mosellana]
MAAFRHLITVPLSIASFVGVFYAIAKLMVFLSLPVKIPIHQVWIVNLLDDWTKLETALLPLTTDAILIVLFILPHSFLKSSFFKYIWDQIGLTSASRSFYNLVTSATLLLLTQKWERVPSATLWNIDVESSQVFYWVYFTVHFLAWLIIYGGSIVMDLPELTGVKQVYYDWNNLLPPLNYKSYELNVLYEHVRHPSFIGFSIILWFPNIMSLDRLLLAILWTTYMFIAWRTDARDVAYQRQQLERKKNKLLK